MRLIRQIVCGLWCKHDFKFTGKDYEGWRYVKELGCATTVWVNQYECTKCGRKDYLIAGDDPDFDWNHGKGDGKLCNIFNQEPNEY